MDPRDRERIKDARPRWAETRCFVLIKAYLCRRRLSHLTSSPGQAGLGGARSISAIQPAGCGRVDRPAEFLCLEQVRDRLPAGGESQERTRLRNRSFRAILDGNKLVFGAENREESQTWLAIDWRVIASKPL